MRQHEVIWRAATLWHFHVNNSTVISHFRCPMHRYVAASCKLDEIYNSRRANLGSM
jgi:hypothetical protein